MANSPPFRGILLILLTLALLPVSGRCIAQESFDGGRAYHPSNRQGPLRQSASGPAIRQSGEAASVGNVPIGEYPVLVAPAELEPGQESESASSAVGPVVTTVSSLLVVLAVFGGLVWVSRRFGGTRTPSGALPEDVLRHLGSAMIDANTRVTFLKVGGRILVIGQNQNGDPQTLSEITDADEVSRLTNRCLGRPEIIGRRAGYAGGAESSRRDLAAG